MLHLIFTFVLGLLLALIFRHTIWEVPKRNIVDGKQRKKWRIRKVNEREYWAEYQNIFDKWVSPLNWDNTGYGVPYFTSYDEALEFIKNWKKSEEFVPVTFEVED